MFVVRPSIAAAVLLVSGCAGGPAGDARTVAVEPGISVKVGSGSQWNASCQMLRLPTLTVVEPPKNGTTEVKPSVNRIGGGTVVGANPCAGRDIEGVGLFYKSNPGFHGADRLKYSVYLPGTAGLPGNTLTTSLDITVK